MENSILFTLIKPYLDFIDKGDMFRKPFNWLYTLLAALNILFPLFLLYQAIDNGIFSAKFVHVLGFLLIWIVIAAAGVGSFQLWWDRRTKVVATSVEGDEFTATPVFSHFIQTLGEWFGSWLAVVGCLASLLGLIFLGDDAGYLFNALGLGFIGGGVMGIFLMPVFGFLVIVMFRFLAEQAKAITTIAKNTTKTDTGATV